MTRLSAAYQALTAQSQPQVPVVQKDTGTMAFPSSSLLFSLGLWPSSTGVPISPLASLQCACVYACIKRLSEDLAKLPIEIKRKSSKGGWVNIDHPLDKLFRRPNAWQTRYEWISYLVTCLQLRGNGYVYVDRDGDGDPRRLIPLLPERVSVLMTPQTGNIYYTITAPQLGSAMISTTPEDVIHVRNISVDGGILGISPIAASQDSIGLALAGQRHSALFFRQGSAPGGTIEVPARLSQEAAMRMAQSWQQAYSGADNAHKVAILEEGSRFQQISISPADAELLDSQKWSAEQVCRIFGVPPWLVGLPVPTGTYSNVEQSQLTYILNTLSGLGAKIEQELERVLLFEDEQDSIKITFDFDSLQRGDIKSRMEAAQIALLNGVVSINEVREREGLEAIEGGDEHRIPLNTGPAGTKPSDTSPEAPVEQAQTPTAESSS